MNKTPANRIMLDHRVYYVFSSDDDSVLIALAVTVSGDHIHWFDTIKERIMRMGTISDHNPEHFVFQRNDSDQIGAYTFVPMTLERYNQKVKNKIMTPRDFPDEETMLRSFEETTDNAW